MTGSKLLKILLLSTTSLVVLPTEATAAPVVAIFAAAAAGAYVAGFTLVGFLTRAAIGLALYALTPKPKAPVSGYQTTQFGTALDQQIVYGMARVSGVRIFDEATGTNNKYLHRIIAFAGHEIDSYNKVYINDEEVTYDLYGRVISPSKYTDYIRIKEHLGTSSQNADADLVAESDSKWTTNHRLRGIAYLYVRFKYNADVFPNGIPEVTALVKGKKVYDPRDVGQSSSDSSTWTWSDNPALCIRDYLSQSYGLNEADANIDDTMITTAANACDATDTLDSSTWYTCNGAFTTGVTPADIIRQLLTTCVGTLSYAQGKWSLFVGDWVAPTLTLDEDNLIGGLQVQTRHPRSEQFNTIGGVFRGEETYWQFTEYPRVTNAAFVTADGGDEILYDMPLTFTDTVGEARRLARIYLERNRQQLIISGEWDLEAFSLRVGDNVNITNSRMGWSSKAFEVISWTFGFNNEMAPVVSMSLRETASTVFDEFDDGVTYELDNTTLNDPFFVPTVGMAFAVSTAVINERILTVLNVTVTVANSAETDFVEVQFKKSSDSTWSPAGLGDPGKYQIIDLEADNYDIRARAINALGIKGGWTTETNYAVDPASVSVSSVTNFSYNLSGGMILLEWDPPTDQSLSYFKIRHALEETGATWANSTTAVNKIARPATSVAVPARPGTYFIRAFSKTGAQSETDASVVVPESALEDFSTTTNDTEHPSFSGTHSNTVPGTNDTYDGRTAADTNPDDADARTAADTNTDQADGGTATGFAGTGLLIIQNYVSAPSTGTYDFTGYIDTTSARRVRARVDLQVTRQDDSSGLFDSLSGNFDSFSGLFDDLTGFSQATDTDVITYIATTTDDPSGTPTWSSWQKFQAGEYWGRAFKFRVTLTSETDNVTPAIDYLVAKVQY